MDNLLNSTNFNYDNIITNFDLNLTILFTFLITFMVISFFNINTSNEVKVNDMILDYVENNITDNSFYKSIIKIVSPDKGDIVILKYGRWNNLLGKVTRYNFEDNSYNIKVTKNLNPNNNDIPKRVINRDRDDFFSN